jgi:hypothetical protein
MPINIRKSETQGTKLGNGVYMARIVGHLDPTYMGGLEVTLLRDDGNSINDNTQTYMVKYASPFYGVTGYDFQGENTAAKNGTQAGFDDTQKSYGISFVPPDVGATVLVLFVEGNAAEGYWFACVQDRFANHMIPGIATSENVDISKEDKEKYNYKQGDFLPVAEINRLANDETTGADIDKIKKPVHPIADVFLQQGLLVDDVRGGATSTIRRNLPNMVFGISTPGPLDRRPGSKRISLGKKQSRSANNIPVSRMGGTQMVFDDGDDQFQRKKPASEGGPEYADLLQKEKGTPNIPYGECFRLRTRTGHQILMHNSEDLIYIGNARGTTWIELSSNGKIDIFAEDSISIHTENDLNIRADRDINLEAGRNINLKTGAIEKTGDGRLQMDVSKDWNVVVGNNSKITTIANLDVNTGKGTKLTAGESTDIKSGAANNFTASSTTDIKSGGNITQTGAQIHFNGPPAADAAEAAKAEKLFVHPNPLTAVEAGWKKLYQDGTVDSIMKRVPMHEPWLLHENQLPDFLTPDLTDREVE